MDEFKQTLISTDWLECNLGASNIRILDSTWYLPGSDRDPWADYQSCHIPGAQFFDIDFFSEENSKLPHMVPSVESFCSKLKKFGIGDAHHIVVYDSAGLFSAARAWWLFKFFGFKTVSVLDGGLPKWVREHRVVSDKLEIFGESHFTPNLEKQILSHITVVKKASNSGACQIIDARPGRRFPGLDPEPRPGLRSGHIPNSRNICYKDLLNSDCTFKDADVLQDIFVSEGIDTDAPIITTCGSGVTAAILFLALHIIGSKDVSLYDGSWTEWASDLSLKVEHG